MLLPKVKLKAIVSFPANILDGIGVDVVKQNGTYQFNLAYDDFAPPISGDTLPDAAHLTSLLWNSTTGSYVLTPISVLGGQGGVADPLMDGAVQAGTALAFSHEDHRHPTDTTLVSKSANLSDLVDVTISRKNLYAAPFDAMAYSGMQINGSMEVGQEKGPSPTTTNGLYICDGYIFSNGTSATLTASPTASTLFPGFPYRLGVSVTAATTAPTGTQNAGIDARIEGWRIARLAWGTSSGQPITISFWTAHDKTGVYSVTVRNSALDRSCVATYTQNISGATEYKTVSIPAPPAGSVWLSDNGIGMYIYFCIAAGPTRTAPAAGGWFTTNYTAALGQVNGVDSTSNNFRITGVIVLPGIEAPSAARSPLIMRPYDQELMTCQRYWWCSDPSAPKGSVVGMLTGSVSSGNLRALMSSARFTVPMRAAPSITLWQNGTQNQVRDTAGTIVATGAVASTFIGLQGGPLINVTNNLVAGTLYSFDLIADIRL